MYSNLFKQFMNWVQQGSGKTLETGLASEKEIPPFSLSTK